MLGHAFAGGHGKAKSIQVFFEVVTAVMRGDGSGDAAHVENP